MCVFKFSHSRSHTVTQLLYIAIDTWTLHITQYQTFHVHVVLKYNVLYHIGHH